MSKIETKPITKITLEPSFNPYSSGLVEVSRVVGYKMIRGKRTIPRRERTRIKNEYLGRSSHISENSL